MAECESEELEVVSLLDEGGKALEVKRHQGRLWPVSFPSEAIKGVGTFKARDDDVIVVSYPKSGSHWVWEIVGLLVAGPTGVHMDEKEDAMLEMALPETIEAIPSPRVLNVHAHFEQMSRDLINNKHCKLVYVIRDPRDVAVSFFHFTCHFGYDGKWKDYFSLFLSGNVPYESWFTHIQGWEKGMRDNPDLQVYVTSYEAHKENPIQEIKRIALFLGTSTEKSFLEDVVKKTSFDSMKADKMKITPPKYITKHGTPVMYRKGKTGDWKSMFTVAQADQFDAVFEKEMKGTRVYELYSNKKKIPNPGGKHSEN